MNSIIFNNQQIIPSKVVCVGRNYVEHIKELGNEMPSSMVLFNKPNSSITDTLIDNYDGKCHYEGEISFLIQNKKITGIGFGLDLTKRDIQSKLKSKGLPWERAKAYDNSAVFSDFVKIENLSSLKLELWINNELKQSGGFTLMIYKPQQILEEILSFMSLEDGDIIMSGTPKGVGTYKKGDQFIGKIFAGEKLLVQKKWIVL